MPFLQAGSVETIIVSDTRHDPTAVKQAIKERVIKPIVCQRSKAICPRWHEYFSWNERFDAGRVIEN